MLPDNHTIELPAGDSRRVVVPVVDDQGAAVPLAGATIRWWVAKNAKATGAAVFIKKSSTSEIEIDSEASAFSFTIIPVDTDGVRPDTYYHEAEITFPDNSVSTVLRGSLRITPTLIRGA